MELKIIIFIKAEKKFAGKQSTTDRLGYHKKDPEILNGVFWGPRG
jgi:hypothetical protein